MVPNRKTLRKLITVGTRRSRLRHSLQISVKFTVCQALENRSRPVHYFEMREVPGTFHLRKYALKTDELGAHSPRRSRAIFEAFDTLHQEHQKAACK